MSSTKDPFPSSCQVCMQDIIRDCAVCAVAERRIHFSTSALKVVFSELLPRKKGAVLTDSSSDSTRSQHFRAGLECSAPCWGAVMKGMLLVTFGAEARNGRIDNVPA